MNLPARGRARRNLPFGPSATTNCSEEIGRGAMGIVYRARQISLNRLVALKMIRTGHLASEQELKRFKMEAEAAAGLEHPNIVSAHEIGEHEGWQYFSMRLVEGRTLAEEMPRYQQDQKEVAKLMAKVARAVLFAHQRGILHRDLKPSNIMLDKQGEPHVTDFGLAKRLSAGNQVTLSGQMVGSPAYMAPEQAQGAKRLSTGADIYSLGAILYELLTGRPPFLGDTPLETFRKALEEEPLRPSEAFRRRQLEKSDGAKSKTKKQKSKISTDLETICLRCLEKDPQRRFGSAEALADELERWLRGVPITSRPIGIWTRSAKWARRRPAAAVVLALVLGGAVVIAWQVVRASRARKAAEAASIKADLVIDFLSGLSASIAPGRDTASLRETLEQNVKRLTAALTNQPAVEAEFRSIVGKVYLTLDDQNKAEVAARDALAMKRKLLGAEHPDVAQSINNLAVVLQKQSRLNEAEAMARDGLAMRQKLLGAEHVDVAESLETLGEVLLERGMPAEAEAVTRRALAIRRKSGVENPKAADLLGNLAVMLEKQDKLADAESLHRETLVLQRKLLGAEDPVLATTLNNLAVVLEHQSKLTEAETMHREALAMRRKLLGNEAREVGTSLNNLAIVLGKQGKLEDTETVLREAVAIQKKLPGSDQAHLAASLYNLAWILAKQGKLDEYGPLLHKALAMQRKSHAEHPNIPVWLHTMARLLAEQGKLREAGDLCSEGIDHSAAKGMTRARLLELRGRLRARSELFAEAIGDFRESWRLNPDDRGSVCRMATLLLHGGDQEAYRLHCRTLLKESGNTTNLTIALRTAKTCLLLPGPEGADLSKEAQLAELCVTTGKDSTNLASFQLVKALAEYRQGNFGQAIESAHKVLKQSGSDYNRDTQAHAIAAMAGQRLGQTNEARAALDRATEMAETNLAKRGSADLGADWSDWIMSHTLLNEAQALIEGKGGN